MAVNWNDIANAAASTATTGGINAVLGVGSSLLGGLLSGSTQNSQNEWAEKMWRMNAEWNSPANQLQLYKDAGLNPAFYMANGASGSSVSASSPSVGLPSVAALGDPTAAAAYRNTSINQQNADTRSAEVRQSIINMQHEVDAIDAKALLDGQLVDESKERIAEIKQRIKESAEHIIMMQATEDMLDAQRAMFYAQASQANTEVAWKAYTEHTKRISALAQRATAAATAALYKKYGEKVDSDIKLTKEQCAYIAEQVKLAGKDGRLKDIEIEYRGKKYMADIRIANGQAKSIEIKNWIGDKTKYAEVCNQYINVIDNVANTTTDVMRAGFAVYTGGASTAFYNATPQQSLGPQPDATGQQWTGIPQSQNYMP